MKEIIMESRTADEKILTKNRKKTFFNYFKNNNCSQTISDKIGNTFYKLGVLVATYPWPTIIISVLLVGFFSLGFLVFHNEKNPLKLWIPRNSKFLRDTEWIMKSFEEGYREELILVTAPNVLEPKYLEKLARMNKRIVEFKNGDINWEEVCFKIPLIAEYVDTKSSRRKRDLIDDFGHFFTGKSKKKKTKPYNPSVDLNPLLFCSIINSLKIGCMQNNLIEIWNYDPDIIGNLSMTEVLEAINKTVKSPVTGHSMITVNLLGDVARNNSGYISSAGALFSRWFLHVNFADVDHKKIGNSAGTEDWSSETILLWEEKFLEVLKELQEELEDDDFKIYYSSGRSFGDISAKTMFQDMDKVFLGAFIMFIFMQLVLSKFSYTELRVALASFGLLCVGMAFASSCGICSVLGVSYGPVHASLPFLLMGLGVDDVFVMIAGYRKIQELHSDLAIPERLGLMLKHAGVSITVTSVTDMVAFLVGGTTILPSLQSFCIFAAFGVLVTYLLVITFFVAVFALDERRIKENRNSIIPCIKHNPSNIKPCCEMNLMQKSIKFVYSKILLTTPGKILVLLTVICYTAFGIQGLFQLKQKFDSTWFIPETTYLSKFISKSRSYYPEMGFEAGIYFGKINYSAEMNNLIEMDQKLQNRTDILSDINSWIEPFNKFVQIYYEKDFSTDNISDSDWHLYLSKFLFSSEGGKFQANFRFIEKIKCGEPAPPIKVASLGFKFKKFYERDEYLPAMYAVEKIVKDMNLSTGDKFATVWGKIFGNWITDEIIDEEVLRNICLALVCVMGCTAILIVNFQICFWIFICVLLTLINVGGFMHFWGLTIDLVSCIGLQLAVGLCVDYAAHIGHTFLTISRGTKTERALETVQQIGAAVLYGGSSTILALIMLSGSEAYTFKAFFKIFLLVIIFGLFHGVVFLPIVLSAIGPKPYHKTVKVLNNEEASIALKSNSVIDEENNLPKQYFQDLNDQNETQKYNFKY